MPHCYYVRCYSLEHFVTSAFVLLRSFFFIMIDKGGFYVFFSFALFCFILDCVGFNVTYGVRTTRIVGQWYNGFETIEFCLCFFFIFSPFFTSTLSYLCVRGEKRKMFPQSYTRDIHGPEDPQLFTHSSMFVYTDPDFYILDIYSKYIHMHT